MTPECRLQRFEKAFREYVANPQVNGTADEFRGYKETHCGLWVSGEEGNEIDGQPAFSYWSMSERYEFGVHRRHERVPRRARRVRGLVRSGYGRDLPGGGSVIRETEYPCGTDRQHTGRIIQRGKCAVCDVLAGMTSPRR